MIWLTIFHITVNIKMLFQSQTLFSIRKNISGRNSKVNFRKWAVNIVLLSYNNHILYIIENSNLRMIPIVVHVKYKNAINQKLNCSIIQFQSDIQSLYMITFSNLLTEKCDLR